MNLVSEWPRAGLMHLLLALPVLSCASTLKVQSGTGTSLTSLRREPGLPFFVKREVYRQHTVYEQRWYDVEVGSAQVIGLDSKTQKPVTDAPTRVLRHLRKTNDARLAINRLQSLVAGFEQTGGTAETAASQKKKLDEAITSLDTFAVDPDGPPEEVGPLLPVRNYLERALIVDYRQVYYLNGNSTWLSAGSINTELAKDGTLAKAEGQGGGGLTEFITAAAGMVTGFLPIKEILQSKWVKESTSPGAVEAVTTVTGLHAEVTVKEGGHRYEFTREFVDPPCSLNPINSGGSAQQTRDTVEPEAAAGGIAEPPHPKLSTYPALDATCVGLTPVDFARGTFIRTALEANGKAGDVPAYSVQGRIELPKVGESDE